MVLLEVSSGGEALLWIRLSYLFTTGQVFWFLNLRISIVGEREDYLQCIKTCFRRRVSFMFKLSSTQGASVDKNRTSSYEVKLTLDSAVSFVSQ
ncbi:unnamed protein product [Brassica napus]|uniref:(rape) hypothetical protein n=1 Tax=Brassica napus TaxID=3708 RepID=A0A816VWJ1_BRANA|nr:unnamed protein product [Brassica napus]